MILKDDRRRRLSRVKATVALIVTALILAGARLNGNAAALADVADRVRDALRLHGLALLSAALFALTWHAPAAFAQSSAKASCKQPLVSGVVINVKDKGAKGNGRADDTAAIQAAIDAAGGTNATVFVPDGIYMVDAVTKRRLSLKNRMTFKMAPGAVLRAIPNSEIKYFVLSISGVASVTVTGGTLEGDRDHHKSEAGEWGIGLYIGRGAKHINVNGVASNKMWGDGFYIQNAHNVSLCQVTADANRRQGLSIIEANGVTIVDSVFKNTEGTKPMAGIDLEPNTDDQKITNILIRNSKFIDNAGGGIVIAGKKGQISKVEITHNTITGRNPIDISHAPHVLDQKICRNRLIRPQSEPSADLSGFGEPVKDVINQDDCGDRRLLSRKHQN